MKVASARQSMPFPSKNVKNHCHFHHRISIWDVVGVFIPFSSQRILNWCMYVDIVSRL